MTPHEVATLVWLRQKTATGEAKRLREAARLSRMEMADLVGVPRPTMQSWENGNRRPTGLKALHYAERLAELERLVATPAAS